MLTCECPPPPFASRLEPSWGVPDDGQCRALWLRYDMPEHIQSHSLAVASMATGVATAAMGNGRKNVDALMVQTTRASALLHDIAKAYTIEFGGSHGQIGAAWVAELTGNPLIAQGIVHHVSWPGELDVATFFVPLVVLYADKRVRHDELVTVTERFEDLFTRYGRSPRARELIREHFEQTMELERRLSAFLGVDLGACTADSGRLVPRA